MKGEKLKIKHHVFKFQHIHYEKFVQYQPFFHIACVASVFAVDWFVLLNTVTHCQTAVTHPTLQSILTTSRFQFWNVTINKYLNRNIKPMTFTRQEVRKWKEHTGDCALCHIVKPLPNKGKKLKTTLQHAMQAQPKA